MQVYKGRLHTGEEVAVKVQRPYVLETVTVDLFIIRSLGLGVRGGGRGWMSTGWERGAGRGGRRSR
jgi:hypothetical protein